MNFKRVKVTTTVPTDHADVLREALGEAGAGVVGDYAYCSFSSIGIGRFKPNDTANPHIGKANELEAVAEERIEVVCDKTVAKHVIAVLKEAHPYEEVIIDIVPLIEEDQL